MAKEAIIHKAQPFDLHGTPYYQLVFSYANEPDIAREARLGQESVYDSPRPGDLVLIETVMDTVVDVRKKE